MAQRSAEGVPEGSKSPDQTRYPRAPSGWGRALRVRWIRWPRRERRARESEGETHFWNPPAKLQLVLHHCTCRRSGEDYRPPFEYMLRLPSGTLGPIYRLNPRWVG